MEQKKKKPQHQEPPDRPTWFHKEFFDHFHIPSDPIFQSKSLNKHADVYNYTHPSTFDLEQHWIDMSKPVKVKSFLNSIQKTQDQLKVCLDSSEIKKLETKLKTLQTKQSKIEEHTGKIVKTMSFQLHFTSVQREIVLRWMNECLRVYNECVRLSSIEKETLPTELKTLRSVVFNNLYQDNSKPAPYETLGDEVRSFLSNRKSCLTNLQRDNIKHFELKNRIFKNFMSINIPSRAVKQSSIFKEHLGPIYNWSSIYSQIQEKCKGSEFSDCRLIYNKLFDCFLLKVPYYTEISKPANRYKVVAVDPGEKIFMSYYSAEQSGHIGYDIRTPILREQAKIKRIDRILKNNTNKKGKKLKNVKRLRVKRRLIFRRINNIVSELHHQTALWLTTNYDRVYIPKFDTKKMLERPKELNGKKAKKRFNRLNKRYKFTLQSLSHYRFRQHLLNKGQEKGCKIEIVDESYTSQCCGACGRLSKKYDSDRVKQCSCGIKIDRDLNGARNILLKTFVE